jgi:FkbM family methyltransferase
MPETTVLTLADGVRIVVPDSLELITPYVLREQGDFFEDELPFVRSLLEPGQTVIDIGANHGVYTLPMAQKVGASGHVWAFEPGPSTAQLLAQSIVANGFTHVTLEQSAVSSNAGSAQLGLHAHSELRAIVHGGQAESGETVPLVTLDDRMERYGWSNIDFIKIDAEGEESNIVKGGRRFFADLEPLVQYELRNAATEMNFDLIADFAAIGYDSYRLAPGLNLLVPFDRKVPADPYLLNLFCCNAAAAARLAARGVLLRRSDLASASEPAGMSEEAADGSYHWRRALAHMPYAASLALEWERTSRAGQSGEVDRALWFYARSRDPGLAAVDRFRTLEASFLQLSGLCDRKSTPVQLASLARVAHDYGARAVSVGALTRLIATIRETGAVDPSEPFLAPMERFESIAPGGSFSNWLLAAALEQIEKRESFSTFYVGPSCRDRLEAIVGLGFAGVDMRRRLDLVRLRISRALAAKGLPP